LAEAGYYDDIEKEREILLKAMRSIASWNEMYSPSVKDIARKALADCRRIEKDGKAA
jgi:hypothetical protein